ncbi:acrosin-like [Myiozetetes cayanensis]|uniref:acrosin-like n=1 Tax=Myiozetetes cayanensis TaxID=478635 RepID=UPI00215F009B|nr:acrosin-like [Myiozetetes cayanensis]
MILLRLLLLLALCGAAHGTPGKCGESCGLWPMRSTTRIVGGIDVQPGIGAWAGIVSIRNLLTEEWTRHVCGGTLIRPKWVLSAAHCFVNRTTPLLKWAVVAGATKIGEMGPHVQVRRIKKVYIHELYDGYMHYDIAVIELKQPMECTPSIQLACLPGPTVRVLSQNCYIAGWGDTYAKTLGPNPVVLKQSGALLIDTRLCNSSDWYGGRIKDYNLCAGYPEGGMSTCQGDSGGPLICQDSKEDFFWEVGLTSWAIGCARPKNPSVFISTQYFYNWIMKKIGHSSGAAPIPVPCPFPRKKLLQFFDLLKELLKFLKAKPA